MSNKSEELFQQAYELQCQGQLQEAIHLYSDLLKLKPEHSQALQFVGIAYAQLGNLQSAIVFLKQAILLEPDNANFHNNLANVYKNAGQIDQAIDHYLEALRLKPDYAKAHHNLATVYASQNNYKDALNHYRLALHAEPDYAPGHFNLGLLLLKNNQLVAAKIQFKNVLTLNPEEIEAEFYLAVLCLQDNELAEAKEHFQNVLRKDSNHIQSLTNLGVIALKEEKGQEAIDYFTKALALDNDYLEARNNLAATFMHYDRFENALMHYDVLLQKEPENIEYLYNSGVAQMALGHLPEAILHFEKLLLLDQNHFAALNNLAAIYIRMEEKDKAAKLLEQALAANPKDESSRHMLNAIKGGKEAKTSPEYARNLFNNYALYYDQHLQTQLHYSLPKHVARLLHSLNLFELNKVIDLGCGTGLTGIVLRDLCKELVGVDISAKMLAKAREKGIYDQLIEANLIYFLEKDKEKYDLALAADVIPYFGELNSLFATLTKRLQEKAFFIFSAEISEDKDWQLQPTARFSHHPDYIAKLCQKYDFELLQQETVVARHQNQEAVKVNIYVLKKMPS